MDEKIGKCKDLESKIQKMGHLKEMVIPVVLGALGMIKKKTEDHIKGIPGNSRESLSLLSLSCLYLITMYRL